MDPYLDGEPLDQLGDALRDARRRLGLSQRGLAGMLGVDHALVGRWEAGDGPVAVARVDGVLRLLGYRLTVVAQDQGVSPPGADDPLPATSDRGMRRFPAHLPPVYGRVRHRDAERYGPWEPVHPFVGDWTYRMDRSRRDDARRGRDPEPG